MTSSDATPARHYILVDDKLRILAARSKKPGRPWLTTVFPRQAVSLPTTQKFIRPHPRPT